MSKGSESKELIKPSARHTLKTFDLIFDQVSQKLGQEDHPSVHVFINEQDFTNDKAQKNLDHIRADKKIALRALFSEPAICRIVALDGDGKQLIYYICRTSPTDVNMNEYDAKLASYRSPIGRIASFSAGDEYIFGPPGQEKYFEIVEKIQLRPIRRDLSWDSLNTLYEHVDHGAYSIDSLLALSKERSIEDVEALLDAILANEGESSVAEGLRREVLSKMGLRDQPILDKFQDEIFRENLISQLLITGPPGTGKTTTLIRRLGLKLDSEFLDEDERYLVDKVESESGQNHKTSWLMFTPTELLKQYVKEAFAKENIPAPEQRLKTWSEFRRHLARNVLGILRTSSPGGTFILKDSLSILNDRAFLNPEKWFDDFYDYLQTKLWVRLTDGLDFLSTQESEPIQEITSKLSRSLQRHGMHSLPALYVELFGIGKTIQETIRDLASETEDIIRRNSIDNLSTTKGFFTDLAIFLDSLRDDDSFDEEDDDDVIFAEDEAYEQKEVTTQRDAIRLYSGFLKSYSRAKIQKRKLSNTSKSAKILKWLGEDRLPPDEDLKLIGQHALMQNNLRRFVNPHRDYVRGIAKIYRKFRHDKIQLKEWYSDRPDKNNHISALEVDLVILAVLKNSRNLLNQGYVKRNIEETRFEFIRSVSGEFKNQILVDEATDFSVIQLACMLNLTHPRIESFFACGDFNQRITNWGCRSEEQLAWLSKKIEIKSINISYRQSKKLNDFTNLMVKTVLDGADKVDLPSSNMCDGVAPVLLKKGEDVSGWLKERIVEIERSLKKLPSIAVLVNSEAMVTSLASELNDKLSEENIQSVACPSGQVMGNDNDVRVFDIQHIKGLEFEAVFFIGIDELAQEKPDLFDKYLYVGATRAATYLGMTCQNGLPDRLSHLEPEFLESFIG